jgi:hypothetical protein
MRSAITLVVAYMLLILQSTVLELAPVRMAAPAKLDYEDVKKRSSPGSECGISSYRSSAFLP